MKCPECKTKLTDVNVYSQYVQRADVDEDGKITEFDVGEILETLDIECPHCTVSIWDIISKANKPDVV